MKSVRSFLLAPAMLACISLAGAAYAVDNHAPKVVRVPHPAANPVTKQQLVDAGAECTGETCTFRNTTWNCANPQACFVEKTN